MKNYLALIVLFIGIAFEVNAQSNYSFGGYYSPMYTNRITGTSSDLNWLKKEWDQLEKGGMGYSVGAFAERTVSEKLTIRGGLGFSSYGERIDSLMDLGIDKFKNDYRFVEVPVVACYSFGDYTSAIPYISLGYSLNYFLNKRNTYSLVGSKREEVTILKDNVNLVNHALRFSAGFDFTLDPKWNLRTELFANSFLSSLSNDAISRRPIALGLSLQLRRK
jgi:hypothetical protein